MCNALFLVCNLILHFVLFLSHSMDRWLKNHGISRNSETIKTTSLKEATENSMPALHQCVTRGSIIFEIMLCGPLEVWEPLLYSDGEMVTTKND